MKFFSFILLVIPVLLFSCASETDHSKEDNVYETAPVDSTYCNCDELTFDESYNHFWRFERRQGFTGKCEEFYPSGKLKVSKNMVDGKLHGKLFKYYENGQIEEQKEFDMNFQTGEQINYTPEGEIFFHALCKRGKQIKVLVSKPQPEEDPWENPN